jgi:hypothetical protein
MLDLVLFALSAPFAIAVGAWLGRKFQRHHWRLDLPYEDRVRLLEGKLA